VRKVLADTFYWIALTNPADPYYRDVIARRDEIADARILTTDAVLSEFLTFFAGTSVCVIAPAAPFKRSWKIQIAASFPKAGKPSWLAWSFTARGPTKAIA
jgi:hypothetical protein